MALLGCVPSLHPLYSNDKDIIWDPTLAGHWVEDDDESWLFSPLHPDEENSKAYRVIILDDDEMEGSLVARLVKLGDQRFLDTTVDKINDQSEYNAMHLAPTHLIWHVKSTSPTLQMRPMNPEWLSDFVEKSPGKIAVEKLEEHDMLVLRAKPKELQSFVLQHLDEDELFSEDLIELKRQIYGKKENKQN